MVAGTTIVVADVAIETGTLVDVLDSAAEETLLLMGSVAFLHCMLL